MNKRKHQIQTEQAINAIIQGAETKTIIAHVTPGAGKSVIPIIAGRLISEGLADAICWVVPRKALQDQGERNFIDPFFRDMFQHRLTIRSATNEPNPCRDQDGFITTYQAIAMDEKQTVLKSFSSKKYVLILDEFHHVELTGVWHKALAPIVDRAAYLVLMTGTLARGDEKPIAFCPYADIEDGKIPVLQDTPEISCIQYGRSEALSESAILPLKFSLSDGFVEWISPKGAHQSGTLSRRQKDASQALFCALETDFADDLLENGVMHWLRHKEENPRSKLLVVTANFDHAKRFTDILKQRGLDCDIATSHESKSALAAIKKFKSPRLDVLVTIAMAYEGLDVPEITHIISLTHIRSVPWIEQMIARAVRIDRGAGPYESQCGYIFAPDDILMREVVERIQAEQLAIVPEKIPQGDRTKSGGNGNGKAGPDIIPIGSRMTGHREVDFVPTGQIRTVKETEEDVLSRIENHVRAFTWHNRYKPGRINAEIKRAFGVPRREMGLKQLKEVLEYVKQNYPLDDRPPPPIEGISRRRGVRPRVPTKAVPWQTSMF